MFRKSFLWLVKSFFAGLTAVLLVCIFSFFYYNTGRHSSNPSGATDYVWDGSKFYCQFREGFGFGVTDPDGFNNAYPGVTSDADILIMGSSHMEAVQVMQKQTAPYLLNEYLDAAGSPLRAYNIGASSHNFYRCARNLPAALAAYSPEYVVIEASELPIGESSALDVLNGSMDFVPSYEGFLYNIQAIPLPKLLMQQHREFQQSTEHTFPNGFSYLSTIIDSYKKSEELSAAAVSSTMTRSAVPSYTDYCGPVTVELISQMSALAESSSAHLIIFFHPTISFTSSGDAYSSTSSDEIEAFGQLCSAFGITFIDMTAPFLENYNENHVFPHGFANADVNSGHLNAHGHRMIADELYRVITELQGE